MNFRFVASSAFIFSVGLTHHSAFSDDSKTNGAQGQGQSGNQSSSEQQQEIEIEKLRALMKGIDLQQLTEQLNKLDLKKFEKSLNAEDTKELQLKLQQLQPQSQPQNSTQPEAQSVEPGPKLNIDLKSLEEELKKIDTKEIEKILKNGQFESLKKIDFKGIEAAARAQLEKSKAFTQNFSLQGEISQALTGLGLLADPSWKRLAGKLAMPETKRLFLRLTNTNWKLFAMSQIVFLFSLIVISGALKPAEGRLARMGRSLMLFLCFLLGSYVAIPLLFLRGDYPQLLSLGGDIAAISKKYLTEVAATR